MLLFDKAQPNAWLGHHGDHFVCFLFTEAVQWWLFSRLAGPVFRAEPETASRNQHALDPSRLGATSGGGGAAREKRIAGTRSDNTCAHSGPDA